MFFYCRNQNLTQLVEPEETRNVHLDEMSSCIYSGGKAIFHRKLNLQARKMVQFVHKVELMFLSVATAIRAQRFL